MRRTLLAYGLMTIVVAGNTGCSTMNNTEKGVGLGAGLGAGVGTIIGHATGNPKTGAVAGALIGGATGGIIGNDMDKQEAREATARHDQAVQQYANTQPERLAEVVSMAKGGQSEQVMLNHIRSHGMRFNLSVSDLDYLKSNGVSDRVIAEMQTGGSPAVQRVTVAPPPQTVVVREEVIVPAYGYGYRPYYHRPRPVFIAPPPPRPAFGATFIVR